MSIPKRAETSAPKDLVDTFVDTGTLEVLLSARDHQVIYGRRGTGKTHALVYLAESRKEQGDIPVYIDLRTVGSTGGIYNDPQIPLAERATRLIQDVLAHIHDALLTFAVENEDALNLGVVGPILDQFIEAATETIVVGNTVLSQSEQSTRKMETSISGGLAAKSGVHATASAKEQDSDVRTSAASSSGTTHHTIKFGSMQATLGKVIDSMTPKRLWILLDEWSTIPLDLQPLLADLLRRTVFPLRGTTVKIAAIDQRTRLQQSVPGGDYIGIEVGADASADLNLDDFMVFDNDAQRAVDFFTTLLFRHYKAVMGTVKNAPVLQSESDFIRFSFTQKTAFEELVRAAEGVPRDAINILGMASQRAIDKNIAVAHVRNAANAWYTRDKMSALASDELASRLLHWIVDEVIAHRKARAFLLLSTKHHYLIDKLFDARLLHVLKRNISAPEQPGIRYDVYKIDYGCYVNLLSTAKDPQGLLPAIDDQGRETYVQVPPDDYRAIRRAILDLDEFESAMLSDV